MAYATIAQLQVYLGGASLPADAQRLLERASDLIDYSTFGKLDPNDSGQMEAAKNATCAQVEYWLQVGEDVDLSGYTFDSISIGTYQMTKATASSSSANRGGVNQDAMAPRARRILFLAGLGYRGVRMI
jgi:hypothetical protein